MSIAQQLTGAGDARESSMLLPLGGIMFFVCALKLGLRVNYVEEQLYVPFTIIWDIPL